MSILTLGASERNFDFKQTLGAPKRFILSLNPRDLKVILLSEILTGDLP